MASIPQDAWIDELEYELGQAAALHLLANAGGQCRAIPQKPDGSALAREVGLDVVSWLADRFGGTKLDIPTMRGRQQRDDGSRLRAAILESGLTDPQRSANSIAAEFGVTKVWVTRLRAQMRAEAGIQPRLPFPEDD